MPVQEEELVRVFDSRIARSCGRGKKIAELEEDEK